MEHFVWDPNFVREMSGHVRTGDPLPASLLESLRAAKAQHSALETLHQVLLSLFDIELLGSQTAHAIEANQKAPGAAVQKLATELHKELMPGCMPPCDSHWPSRFGHLTTYGGTYYGYLYNKAFAAQLWNRLFDDGRSLDQAAGTKLWVGLLKPGGSRDASELLRETLGQEPALGPFFEELYCRK
mmetsp:Transcript_23116/g.52136  ORF Transcript_23116/g.52136 Transcript_23116/m.52136 type:complete len:185 (+) Transcript_23116:1993-2547(+)